MEKDITYFETNVCALEAWCSQGGHCEEQTVPRCTLCSLAETLLSTLKSEAAYFS
jgi:hypothetical protein